MIDILNKSAEPKASDELMNNNQDGLKKGITENRSENKNPEMVLKEIAKRARSRLP